MSITLIIAIINAETAENLKWYAKSKLAVSIQFDVESHC